MSWNAKRFCPKGSRIDSEYFGLMRHVNGDSRQYFEPFLNELKSNVNGTSGVSITDPDTAGLRVMTRGMVSDAIQAKSLKNVEKKDLRRWPEEIINSLGEVATQEIPLQSEEIRLTLTGRNHHIGSFVVLRSSQYHERLVRENQMAIDAMRTRVSANGKYRRRALYNPRIDIFKAPNEGDARLILAEAQEIAENADEFYIALAGVEAYRAHK